MPLGRIDHTAELPKMIGALRLMDAEMSDVIVKVRDESFLVHSLILSGQSTYFKEQFYGPANKKQVTLPGANCEVFRDILDYLYTGKLELRSTVKNYISEVVNLAKYLRLQPLQRDVVDDVCARMLEEEPVTEDILEFYDQEAEVVITTEMFQILPQDRIQTLLTRDTFYVTDELDIFKAVMRWGEGRSEVERKAILETVRLPLIAQKDLVNDVYLTNVYTVKELFRALRMQINSSEVKPRTSPKKIITIPEQNVIPLGSEVVQGSNPEFLLATEHHPYTATTGFTWHKIPPSDGQEGIMVTLDNVYNINTLEMHLQDKDERLVFYYVEVSTKLDGHWTRVVDYSQYKCRGRQVLHFEAAPDKCVKVVGTASTVGEVFGVVSMKCYFTENPLHLTQGFVEPKGNQALSNRGALVTKGTNGGCAHAMLDGEHTVSANHSYCAINQAVEVVLPQPVILDSLRMKLYDWFHYTHRYNVEASLDGQTWVKVADKSDKDYTSWQVLQFDKRPVSFLRFTCTGGSQSYLHIVYLECPSQSANN